MSVFTNKDRTHYVLTSYKAAYSRFLHSPAWTEIATWPTVRMLASSLIKRRAKFVFQVVRHPVSRTISFFRDKLRIQPTLINQQGFKWQGCHRIFFPHLDITDRNFRPCLCGYQVRLHGR